MKCSKCGHINETRKKKVISLTEGEFAQFWSIYPRKVSKFLCAKIWKKIEQQPGLFEKILNSLARQGKTTQWQQGIIPNPSTWLHQRRWDDEMTSSGTYAPRIESQDPSKEEKEQSAKEKAEALMEIEWAKRQAMRNAALRDELRSQKMDEAWGNN